MTLFLLAKAKRSSITSTQSFSLFPSLSSFHGFRRSTSLCSSYSEGRLQHQRGLPFNGGQKHQVWVPQGSSLPMSCFPHSCIDSCVCTSYCQSPSFLSSSFQCIPQEKLLALKKRDFQCKNFVDGFSMSQCLRANFCVYVNGFLKSASKSNWVLPMFGFGKEKLLPLGCRGYCRTTCNSDEEERESDDEVDDGGESVVSEGTYVSSADPVEVCRVAKVIDELFALDRNMEAVLDECEINLSNDLVIDVLRRFRHARRPAFRFFCWAGQRPGYSHDSRTYNEMLLILGKTRQFETMGPLLDEMGEKGLLNMDSFRIAIKAYAAGKERKKAVGVFELIKKYGFKAGVETINWLLDALVREKFAKEAQLLYDSLKIRFTPNMKTYSILLSGWCKIKNLLEAGKIWNEMIDQGLQPDLVTYHIMLDGLLKVKKRSDAIKLFEVMKAKGPAPNVRSYTILIRDLCKQTKMKEALAYFNEMLESGCKPDAAVYTCLITGFGNLKKMDMVYGLLKEMKNKGYPPDAQLYNALIKLMTNRRMPDDAVRIYKKMIANNLQPTIHTYNMMMKSYFLAGNSDMACAVWNEMALKGCCPDENSYTVLIGGLIRQGRSEEACKYVEEMINKGMRVPEIDFNKFAADFSRVGRPNILDELARKMRLSGKPEVSEVFARWAQMTQKRGSRRGMVDTDA